NSDVAGRYLFGGATTDKPPLPTTTELIEGSGSRVGYKGVLSERIMADVGQNGIGRLGLSSLSADPLDPDAAVTVSLAEDGMHSFGFKLTADAFGGTSNIAVSKAGLTATPPRLDFTFPAAPDAVQPGSTVSLRLTMPDGESVTVEMKAVTEPSTPPVPNEFVIGADPTETSNAFMGALTRSLERA